MSAGTDDTATAREEAIISSLVADHWTGPVCEKTRDCSYPTQNV